MLAQGTHRPEACDQLRRQILRMGGGEPDPFDPCDLAYGVDQIGKIGSVRLRLSIGVHVLSQEGYLPDALPGQRLDLTDDLRQGAALFPPPECRYDAVGAEVVAPLHDRHKGTDRTRRRLRDDVERGDLFAKAGLRLPAPVRSRAETISGRRWIWCVPKTRSR